MRDWVQVITILFTALSLQFTTYRTLTATMQTRASRNWRCRKGPAMSIPETLGNLG